MGVHRLEREFLYNGVKLPDTVPTITPEQKGTRICIQKSLRLRLRGLKRSRQTGLQVCSRHRSEAVRHTKAARPRRR